MRVYLVVAINLHGGSCEWDTGGVSRWLAVGRLLVV